MFQFDRISWMTRLWVVSAGAVCVFGFAPFHIWPLPIIALAFLAVRLHRLRNEPRPARAGFGTGLLFGLGWFSASCFWIASAFFERGPEFLPLVPPLVGGLAILLSLFWALAAAFTARRFARGGALSGALAFVATFTLAEIARGHVLSGFPWNLAGYTFEPGGWGSQTASLVGIYGLTMLVYAVSASLGLAWVTGRKRNAVAGLGMLAIVFGFGAIRLHSAELDYHSDVRLRIVSVDFRQSEKINPETAPLITRRFLEKSLTKGIEDITHLIWPEGAVNGVAMDDFRLLAAMGYQLTAIDNSPPVWIMNSIRMEVEPDLLGGSPKRRYFNSAVAVQFDDLGNPAIVATNDKKKLVPFGEFIPGGEWVEALGARLVSTAIASMSSAEEKQLSDIPGLPTVSPQICYEVIFPGLTPRGKDGRRAEAILNQSNDAWFGNTIGPDQHAAIARYRAIEEGVPLIRSAANGVSGVFDPYGRSTPTDKILSPDGRAFVQDAPLPQSLNRRSHSKIIVIALLLLNSAFLLIALRLRGAG